MKKAVIPPISVQRQLYRSSARTLAPEKKKSKSQSYIEALALRKFLIDQVRDIYWVEKHLLKVIPRLEKSSSSDDLNEAFSMHLELTEEHVNRLEVVFELLEERPHSKKCEAMDGLIRETENMISDTREGTVTRDAALIAAAHKIVHYKIASYSSMVYLSRILGDEEAALMLEETLKEEKRADTDLSMLAVNKINAKALRESVSLIEDDYEDEE
jgi:ferritin-like metal-binding protein YciE